MHRTHRLQRIQGHHHVKVAALPAEAIACWSKRVNTTKRQAGSKQIFYHGAYKEA